MVTILRLRGPPAGNSELCHPCEQGPLQQPPAGQPLHSLPGRVVYQLPRTNGEAAVRMSEIFGVIQKAAPTLEIQDYSASQTTLQDVRVLALPIHGPTSIQCGCQ